MIDLVTKIILLLSDDCDNFWYIKLLVTAIRMWVIVFLLYIYVCVYVYI